MLQRSQTQTRYTILNMLLWRFGLDMAPRTLVVMVREVSSYQSKIYFYTGLLHSLPLLGVWPPSCGSAPQHQVENGAAHVRRVRHSHVLFVR